MISQHVQPSSKLRSNSNIFGRVTAGFGPLHSIISHDYRSVSHELSVMVERTNS